MCYACRLAFSNEIRHWGTSSRLIKHQASCTVDRLCYERFGIRRQALNPDLRHRTVRLGFHQQCLVLCVRPAIVQVIEAYPQHETVQCEPK